MQVRRSFVLAATAFALTLTVVGPAAARSDDVIVRGACSGASDHKLKLGPRDGRIEVAFEVDSNRNGQVWNVTLADNGTSFFSGAAITRAPSGSFTVRAISANLPGTDVVTATATNPATGEHCVASASL